MESHDPTEAHTRTPPPRVLRRRREGVADLLRRHHGSGVLLLPAAPVTVRSRDSHHPYRPDSDLFWATGVVTPETVAVLRVEGEDAQLTLFGPSRDPDFELWNGPAPSLEALAATAGADQVHDVAELEAVLPDLLDGPHQLFYRLGAEARTDRLVRAALTRARLRGARRGTGPRSLVDPGAILDDLRLRKDAWEVACMRRAAQLTVEAFRELAVALRPGVDEAALQAVVESGFRRRGSEGPAYETIVGSGPNACFLHYVENARTVEAGDLVLVDAGGSWGWYAGDVTRTLPAAGRFTPPQRAVYEVVEAARRAAVDCVAPGVAVDRVHEAAASVLAQGLRDLGIENRGDDELPRPFFPHQTSHWLGLDVHDVGDYAREGEARILEPGMVLTVEPGLYFGRLALEAGGSPAARYQGIGVRIEDDVLVTEDGHENLTQALPTAPDAVEALVGGG